MEENITNTIVEENSVFAYSIALKINTMLNILTFTIIIIFLYKFLKIVFLKDRGIFMYKHKKILLFLLLFIFLFLLNNKSFASDSIDEFMDSTYKYYFIIHNPLNDKDYLFISDSQTTGYQEYNDNEDCFYLWACTGLNTRCYYFDSSNNEWVSCSVANGGIPGVNYRSAHNGVYDYEFKWKDSNGNRLSLFKYSNYDIYYHPISNGVLAFGTNEYNSSIPTYGITFSSTDTTSSPITAYSNYFNYEDSRRYQVFISSSDISNWTLMNYETMNYANGDVKFRFNYKLYKNDSYHFKFVDNVLGTNQIISITVTNIITSSSSSYSKNIPMPYLSYEKDGDNFIIKTQSFTADEYNKYNCVYSNNANRDMIYWSYMENGSKYNSQLNQYEYYFYTTIPVNSENTVLYFAFFDYNLQEYGSIATLNCNIQGMLDYTNNLSSISDDYSLEVSDSRINKILDNLKGRLGFFTYPFELSINIYNRIMNIEYNEPIIHIPVIRDPVNNFVIFNGYDFNFNSLLDNAVFLYIHNLYLSVVDAVLVFMLLRLMINIGIKELLDIPNVGDF